MSEPFVGEIKLVGFNFAPRGWALCTGQLLAISSNTALFSLLGTTFGGDGRTSFGLPDMRGRVPVGVGTGPGLTPRSWGQRSGAEYTQHTVSSMPSHNHVATIHGESAVATSANPAGRMLGLGSNIYASVGAGPDLAMAAESVVVNNTGSGQQVNNMQPFLGVYYTIALQGLFPSRS